MAGFWWCQGQYFAQLLVALKFPLEQPIINVTDKLKTLLLTPTKPQPPKVAAP